MKSYIVLATGLLLAVGAQAQRTTTPPQYQFCILYEGPNSKWTLDYEHGVSAPNQEADLTQQAQAVKSLSEVQALNYLGRHGWEFVSTSTRTSGERYISTSTQYLWRRLQ